MTTQVKPLIKKRNLQNSSTITLVKEIANILEIIFPKSSIHTYTFDTDTPKLDLTYSNKNLWPIPKFKMNWFKRISAHKHSFSNFLYIADRKNCVLTDFKQLKKDQENYQFDCNDGLFLFIKTESNTEQLLESNI